MEKRNESLEKVLKFINGKKISEHVWDFIQVELKGCFQIYQDGEIVSIKRVYADDRITFLHKEPNYNFLVKKLEKDVIKNMEELEDLILKNN